MDHGTATRDCQRNRQAGYSLAEVLTAVMVTAMVSATAVPNLTSFVRQYQLLRAAHQIAFEVSRARMKAVGENAFMRLRLGSNGPGEYWLERSNDGVTYALDGAVLTVPGSVSMRQLTSQPVTFNRQGLASAPVTYQLTNTRAQTKTVQVNVLGRVDIQ